MKKIFQHYVSTLIGILTINPIKFTSYIPPIYWFQSIMLLEFMICHTFVTTKNITKFPCFVFKVEEEYTQKEVPRYKKESRVSNFNSSYQLIYE